jgi:hypothetical protein
MKVVIEKGLVFRKGKQDEFSYVVLLESSENGKNSQYSFSSFDAKIDLNKLPNLGWVSFEAECTGYAKGYDQKLVVQDFKHKNIAPPVEEEK